MPPTPLTPEQRSLRAKLAVETSWAKTSDRATRTAKAREASFRRFEREVDPEGVLTPEERTLRAQHARKAHMARMSYLAAKARQKGGATDAA